MLYNVYVETSSTGLELNIFTLFPAPKVSHAGFSMELSRKSTSYVFNYYVPSALFVVVSWATFVIPVEAIPGRIALIITTFLVLVNIANSAFSNSPTAHGINLIQVSNLYAGLKPRFLLLVRKNLIIRLCHNDDSFIIYPKPYQRSSALPTPSKMT